MGQNKKVTIKDVAKLSGVSPSTVSRTLNNYEYVKKSTRAKVTKAIEDLNFRPNEIARSLIMKRTKTIGLIVDDISNPFYSEISRIIINKSREMGYDVIIYDTNGENDNLESVFESLLNKKVSGILIGSVNRKDKMCKEISDSGFPVVLFNRCTDQSDLYSVTIDNKLGAYLAVKHLVDRGHYHIAFLSGSLSYSTFHERYLGYLDALKYFGISYEAHRVYDYESSKISIHEYINGILNTDKKTTAFIAASDHMAITVLDAVSSNHLKIPEDVSVIGFDNIAISKSPYIGLTTISQQKNKMATIALEKLIHLVEDKKLESHQLQVKLEPKLVVRKTT